MTFQSAYNLFSYRNYRALLAALFLVSMSSSNFVVITQSLTAKERKVVIHKSPSLDAVAVTAVRHLNGEDWLERLEVEVKNVSGRPVYCLVVPVILPVVITENGVPGRIVMPLRYGRFDLLKEGYYATADDKPIKPGESHVLKIPEADWKTVETRLALEGIQASALRKVLIRVESVSFGDGTGFSSGLPFSFKRRH